MQITILGIHPIEADEPCDLIEVLIAPRTALPLRLTIVQYEAP